MYDKDGMQDDIEEIVADTQKQCLTNEEASYLLHDSFKKKNEMMDKRKKLLFIHPYDQLYSEYSQSS